MSEKLHGLPKAKIEKSYLTKALWLIPGAAVALCAFFLLQDFVFSGPTITIYFQNADGLEKRDSQVKYLGIKIGQVETLDISKDRKRVVVRAKLNHSAAGVANQGSAFWIVRPEVKLGGISGLRTIVSGNYVTVQPGNGVRTNTFVGLEQAPIPQVQSINITLLTHDLGSLQKQSPIFYWGIQVGEVMDFHFADDASTIVVNARIRQDYAPLVRMDSKFWRAGGIDIHAGLLSGLTISAESASTLITGGIAFATPPHYGAPATNGTIFALAPKEEEAWKDWTAVMPLHDPPSGDNEKSSLPSL